MSLNSPRDYFAEEVQGHRDDYMKRRDSTRLVTGGCMLDTSIDRVDDITHDT